MSKITGEDHLVGALIDRDSLLAPIGKLGSDGLVLPYVEDPMRGFSHVEALWEYPDTVEYFLHFQREVFGALCSLYRNSNTSDATSAPSAMFASRTEDRMADLAKIGDVEVAGPWNHSISVRGLIDDYVPVFRNGSLLKAPSLSVMVNQLREELKKPFAYGRCTIYADSQPSNVVAHHADTKITDLSDVRNNEDAAWDVAKWMKYVSRFHGIVKARNQTTQLRTASELWRPSSELLLTRHKIKSSIEQLRLALVDQVSDAIGAEPRVMRHRSILGEFVANVSTLRRHLLKYPGVSPLVLEAIVESYGNAINSTVER